MASHQQKLLSETSEGYVKTATHNYISRKAHVFGAKFVELKGKSVVFPGATVRGDLGSVPIRIGRYVMIGKGSIVRPASYFVEVPSSPALSKNDDSKSDPLQTTTSLSVKYLPLTIGAHTLIGEECIIEAVAIGTSARIGDNCILSERCVVKDCCVIESNTVIPPDMVIPPFSFVSGVPARIHHCAMEPPAETWSKLDEKEDLHCLPQLATYGVPESAATDFVEDSQGLFNKFVLELERRSEIQS